MRQTHVDIEPGVGLGPFRLGMSRQEVAAIMSGGFRKEFADSYEYWHWRCYYVRFSSDDATVDEIGASEGFEGKLFGCVGIGNRIRDLEEITEVDFGHNDWFLPRFPGVSVLTPGSFEDPTELEDINNNDVTWIVEEPILVIVVYPIVRPEKP